MSKYVKSQRRHGDSLQHLLTELLRQVVGPAGIAYLLREHDYFKGFFLPMAASWVPNNKDYGLIEFPSLVHYIDLQSLKSCNGLETEEPDELASSFLSWRFESLISRRRKDDRSEPWLRRVYDLGGQENSHPRYLLVTSAPGGAAGVPRRLREALKFLLVEDRAWEVLASSTPEVASSDQELLASLRGYFQDESPAPPDWPFPIFRIRWRSQLICGVNRLALSCYLSSRAAWLINECDAASIECKNTDGCKDQVDSCNKRSQVSKLFPPTLKELTTLRNQLEGHVPLDIPGDLDDDNKHRGAAWWDRWRRLLASTPQLVEMLQLAHDRLRSKEKREYVDRGESIWRRVTEWSDRIGVKTLSASVQFARSFEDYVTKLVVPIDDQEEWVFFIRDNHVLGAGADPWHKKDIGRHLEQFQQERPPSIQSVISLIWECAAPAPCDALTVVWGFRFRRHGEEMRLDLLLPVVARFNEQGWQTALEGLDERLDKIMVSKPSSVFEGKRAEMDLEFWPEPPAQIDNVDQWMADRTEIVQKKARHVLDAAQRSTAFSKDEAHRLLDYYRDTLPHGKNGSLGHSWQERPSVYKAIAELLRDRFNLDLREGERSSIWAHETSRLLANAISTERSQLVTPLAVLLAYRLGQLSDFSEPRMSFRDWLRALAPKMYGDEVVTSVRIGRLPGSDEPWWVHLADLLRALRWHNAKPSLRVCQDPHVAGWSPAHFAIVFPQVSFVQQAFRGVLEQAPISEQHDATSAFRGLNKALGQNPANCTSSDTLAVDRGLRAYMLTWQQLTELWPAGEHLHSNSKNNQPSAALVMVAGEPADRRPESVFQVTLREDGHQK